MKAKGSFQEGRVRLPAFVTPVLKARLKTLAFQSGLPFQEYLERVLESGADKDEKARKEKGA